MIEIFLKALAIGFVIALPVGPIGILCINRAMSHGFSVGLLTGLGAATADGVYGLIAALGISVITNFLIKEVFWIQLIGGVFLCYLGLSIIIQSRKPIPPAQTKSKGIFITTFFLTLTNPATILAFIAIFAGLGFGSDYESVAAGITLVTGIFLGSLLWWLILSGFASFLGRRFGATFRKTVGVASGSLIVLFGLFCIF